ncbi:PstS family phosphate ABC transporter substrate-binding protein [Evansella sp. AB-rgal1]|uniref:PstS family phosphate ABC transporter substrate-binding protein n=1 Tax=Evansella sp. AB-rgal1 TaxID=3242696 RepID=UPI00359CF75B
MKKNNNLVLKVVVTLVTSGLLLFFGFVAVIFSLVMGGQYFYSPLIAIVIVGLVVFLVLGMFRLVKPKFLRISMICFFGLCVTAITVYESREAYLSSLEIATNHEVDLYQYQPYKEGSKVLTLDEEATLSLEGDLPILDGATALYPLYAAFAQAIYPEKTYDVYDSEVMSNKTGTAYMNLLNGNVDIIFAAGPSKSQLSMAESRGKEFELTPIGREAFVFFVNARNPVGSLTLQQVQQIYSGDITNWNDVGGRDEEIRAFQRPPDSGSQTALENLMGDIPLMDPPSENIVGGMGGIIEETSNYRNHRNAIGYSFRYFSTEMVQNGDIRLLEINGVPPNKETIRNGEYPISSEFYAITAGSENENIEDFIEWILSDQGQKLVEQVGYVPIRETDN